MDKAAFNNLFMNCATEAIQAARTITSKDISPEFVVEMHGGWHSGKIMSPNDALNLMYINDSKFYRIIDIGVKAVEDSKAILFVRISDHEPAGFEQTWNTPSGHGSFKIIPFLKL